MSPAINEDERDEHGALFSVVSEGRRFYYVATLQNELDQLRARVAELERAAGGRVLASVESALRTASRRVAAVEALCDDYRANCDPTSTQAQVAEIFRAALAAAAPRENR